MFSIWPGKAAALICNSVHTRPRCGLLHHACFSMDSIVIIDMIFNIQVNIADPADARCRVLHSMISVSAADVLTIDSAGLRSSIINFRDTNDLASMRMQAA